MKPIRLLKFMTLFLTLSPLAHARDISETLKERLNRASETLDAFTGEDAAPDLQIPRELFRNAVCVVIIPGYKRAGFIFGGSYGRGVATCRNESSKLFENPHFVSLIGGSYGLQIGGESTDVVLVMTNPDAPAQFARFKSFKLGVEAAVSLGPIGRDLQAGTNLYFQDKILSYARSRGLYAGLLFNGAKLSVDRNADIKANQDYYQNGKSEDESGVASSLEQLVAQINQVK